MHRIMKNSRWRLGQTMENAPGSQYVNTIESFSNVVLSKVTLLFYIERLHDVVHCLSCLFCTLKKPYYSQQKLFVAKNNHFELINV